MWFAVSHTVFPDGANNAEESGKTPLEACINLWIEIHKPYKIKEPKAENYYPDKTNIGG